MGPLRLRGHLIRGKRQTRLAPYNVANRPRAAGAVLANNDAPVGERDVDFVVVGFGLGAGAVLLGVMIGGWLAGRAERTAAAASSPAAVAHAQATAAEYRAVGQTILYAGSALVLATAGGLAGGLDDRTGALLVATVATVGAAGTLVWGYLYRVRHPMPSRPRRQAPRAPDAVAGAGLAPAASEFAPFLARGAVAAAASEHAWPDSLDSDFAEVPTNGDHDALEPVAVSLAAADLAAAHDMEEIAGVNAQMEAEIEAETEAEGEDAVEDAVEVEDEHTPPGAALVAPGEPATVAWPASATGDDDENGEG